MGGSTYSFALLDEDGEHEVFYFPPVKKELLPQRDRAMELIRNMGGKVSKKYDVGVIELAPPGTTPQRPGLTFFDWTWVFDCHGEGILKERDGYAMRLKPPNSAKRKSISGAVGAGKSGKRVPFTINDDKELIRWCLTHGDSRPSFEKALEQGVCAGHGSMESLRGRCRNHAMLNVALVDQVKREIERANKASAASPGGKATDEPFTQAQSESENDDDYDDFAAEEARQEEEQKARAKKQQKRKQQAVKSAAASPPRPPTAQAQAALAAARAESQEWETLAKGSTRRRESVADDDNDDDLVGQLLSNADHGRQQGEAEQPVGEHEYGSDDDLVDSLLTESTGATAAAAAVTTPSEGRSRKRGTPSTQRAAAAAAAPTSAASSRKKPKGTPAGSSSATAASTDTSARDVIDALAKRAQCTPAVAVHALLVCTGVPAHAYAYLIGKNDGNLPKDVHVWTCEEDKVMQAVSNALLSQKLLPPPPLLLVHTMMTPCRC